MMQRAVHTDKELLEMIAHQNERAFTLLYNRYYAALCTTAYKKIPDEPVVEEIVQDVFVVLWKKAAQLDLEGDLKSYLFATLRNKVLYELRTRMAKYSQAVTFEPVKEFASSVNVADMMEAKELEERIYAAIEELSPQSREAFKLSRFEQMPYKKIAEQLNVSVGTVEKHISKALSALRKEFSEVDNSLLFLVALYLLHSKS